MRTYLLFMTMVCLIQLSVQWSDPYTCIGQNGKMYKDGDRLRDMCCIRHETGWYNHWERCPVPDVIWPSYTLPSDFTTESKEDNDHGWDTDNGDGWDIDNDDDAEIVNGDDGDTDNGDDGDTDNDHDWDTDNAHVGEIDNAQVGETDNDDDWHSDNTHDGDSDNDDDWDTDNDLDWDTDNDLDWDTDNDDDWDTDNGPDADTTTSITPTTTAAPERKADETTRNPDWVAARVSSNLVKLIVKVAKMHHR